MARVHYIGDEATAAGYRLAGVQTRVPPQQEATATFRHALESGAELVLLSAAIAELLPREVVAAALLGEHPLVAIVPDLHGRHLPPDVAREVRLALGIEP